jgi:hypothetical protein
MAFPVEARALASTKCSEQLFSLFSTMYLSPSGGAGTLSAMHDAVALANWICSLPSNKFSELEPVFKEYHAERYPIVKEAYKVANC